MRRFTVGISFLLASLFLVSCDKYRPFVVSDAKATGRAEERATWEALFGTVPPTDPFDPFGNIENKLCGMFSYCETGTPQSGTTTPTSTAQGTPDPAYQEVVVNGQGDQWVWYYSSPAMVEIGRLGVVSDGSLWDVISAEDDESSIQISIRGWIPESDFLIFGETVQVEPCIEIEHTQDHTGEKLDCHTHIWGADVLAQVPPGMTGQITSDTATSRNYRDTLTGEWTYGPGWEIVFELDAWIPAENGDLK